MDAADADGDGDLDLVVGGYSSWKPPSRELGEAELGKVRALRDEIAELEATTKKLLAAATEQTKDLDEAQRRKQLRELYMTPARPLLDRRQALQGEVDALVGKPQRKAFVWLYRNRGRSPEAAR